MTRRKHPSVDELLGDLPVKRPQGGRVANPYRDALMQEQTRIARIKADVLAGKLVEAAKVEAAWSALVLDLRAALLALPSRVGARLGLAPAAVAVLDRELRDALEALGGSETSEGASDGVR